MEIRVILVAIMAFTVIANLAHAQDGVFIDPDSPSGKEYEIPLETVRRGAEPGTDPSAPITQGERNAVPFGEGITGNSGGDNSAGAGAGDESSGAGQTNGGTEEPERRERSDESAGGSSPPEIVEAAASNPGAPPTSTGSTLLYVGGGVLVLALGVGAGVLLRRRQT